MIDMFDYGHDTIVIMSDMISKSRFKAEALELFRQVEKSGHPIIITDRGVPVLKLVPYKDELEDLLAPLRGSVVEYVDPTEPLPELSMDLVEFP
jgi:prevent-host-death family protein